MAQNYGTRTAAELCRPASFYDYCRMKAFLLSACLFFLLQPLLAQKTSTRDLQQLKALMTGSFSNHNQAKADTSFQEILLEIRPIWTRRKDGVWLYVEQAIAASPARPYRQRVYHLYIADDSTLVSQVFELKEPDKYAGWWKEPRRFDSVKFQALGNKVGCEVYLRKTKSGGYTGGTEGQDCLSTLQGASYATSEAAISKNEMRTWDRGWNADQQQVWGSRNGPYIFVRTIRK